MITDSELIENARKPFELNVSDGDAVTIVSDTGMDPSMWSILNTAARSMGLEPVIALMPEPSHTQANPPEQVREAMLASDICVMATSKASVHSDPGIEAQKQGIGLIAMEEITPQILAGGASGADYDAMFELGKVFEEKINAGKTMTVNTPAGTDLQASIADRSGFSVAGKIDDHPGLPEFRIAAFPDGEASISPVEGTSNGTIVWDTSMHEIGLLSNPIEADVEDGYVTDIRGGQEADQLRQMLESANDPDVYNLAEIAVGINPQATITGIMRQDKKAQGYIHMAVGANADTGGTIEAPLHIDGIASGATVAIDQEPICEDGKLVV
jgi:leucyl aminopeptidase (aminopeptidase T)